ncbi:Glutathione transport system permease protein GsiC [Polystyrenella longa]|uniref:Glutathione transport system permease protein GsiC n=1 Tax=Polystyrenella longa TaxID=2528007 RepID=A0A518CQI1_9PLAN|nr:ABC transporter permease [Polystyrenella longa]QDU81481.1 Glutathione transport system permease protein GsiC [Polystyrenella longa]
MWSYVIRRIFYNIPVYLAVVLFVMLALRVNDPVTNYLGKNASEQEIETQRQSMGLDRPFYEQYFSFLGDLFTLSFDEESWGNKGVKVSTILSDAIVPSLSFTIPALIITSLISTCVGLFCASFRGRWPDRLVAITAVLGMSVSLLVYTILGQYFGAFWLTVETGWDLFAIGGYERSLQAWPYYCLLPIIITTTVALGYDARFYRAVMVEETNKNYITTARAKGASKTRVMFGHLLKNAMIPITTHIAATIPFLITGSLVIEQFFTIPGMGLTLIQAVQNNDFPIVQAFTAVLAGIYIITNILTDVVYAWLDPRIRLT